MHCWIFYGRVFRTGDIALSWEDAELCSFVFLVVCYTLLNLYDCCIQRTENSLILQWTGGPSRVYIYERCYINKVIINEVITSGSWLVFPEKTPDQDKAVMKIEWMKEWLYENSLPRLTKAVFVLYYHNVSIINSILMYVCYKHYSELVLSY